MTIASDTSPRNATAPAAPAAMPSLPAIAIIAFYAVREMARRRRLVSLSLLMLVPVALLLAARLWLPVALAPESLLAMLVGNLLIPFLIPVVAMAVGTSAIGEPIEDGTLVYYWTRPIRRSALYLGRLLAAQAVAGGLLVLALATCFVMLMLGGFGAVTLAFIKLYLMAAVVVLLGAAVYTAIFACVGTWLKRPLLVAILFVFGWETLVSGIPQRIQEWTIRFHLRNLIDWPDLPAQDLRGVIEDLLNRALARQPMPAWQSGVVLIIVVMVATFLGVVLLRRRELDRQGG